MTRSRLTVGFLAVSIGLVLITVGVAPAGAATDNTSDDTGIVETVTPDFLGDLMADLPVPDFVKDMFGADTSDGGNTTNSTS